jgi:hypothetical protein
MTAAMGMLKHDQHDVSLVAANRPPLNVDPP